MTLPGQDDSGPIARYGGFSTSRQSGVFRIPTRVESRRVPRLGTSPAGSFPYIDRRPESQMPLHLTEEQLNQPVTTHIRTDFTNLYPTWTVGEALDHMRRHPPPGRIIYFYVVDDSMRLVGVV